MSARQANLRRAIAAQLEWIDTRDYTRYPNDDVRRADEAYLSKLLGKAERKARN